MNKKIGLIIAIPIILVIAVITSIIILHNNRDENESVEVVASSSETIENNVQDEIQEIREEVIFLNAQDNNKTQEIVTKTSQKPINENTSNASRTSNTNNKNKYYIKVNYNANVVTIYEKDENGEYTVPVKAMICSTGTSTPTSGTYSIKLKWVWLHLFGDVYGHYVTQINGNILFHSVPYLQKAENTLEYWEYDKLGTSASMGCVRLRVIDSKWIYDNVASGTIVEFYSDGNPGPLGKPSAMKISDNVECRDWDPTDPNENNPWNNRVEPINNVEEENNIQEEQNVEEEQQTEIENSDLQQSMNEEVQTATETEQNEFQQENNVNENIDESENNSIETVENKTTE